MEQTCGNCEHFIKHYIFMDGRFSPIDDGHCTYPMIKNRTTDHKACKHFTESKKNEIQVIEIKIRHKTL